LDGENSRNKKGFPSLRIIGFFYQPQVFLVFGSLWPTRALSLLPPYARTPTQYIVGLSLRKAGKTGDFPFYFKIKFAGAETNTIFGTPKIGQPIFD
jgi:hypothetical protein